MNVGLDFGTTNTVLAYEEDGEIKYLTFDDQDDTYENLEEYLLPSAVYIKLDYKNETIDEHIYVGKKAFANRFSNRGKYVSSVKRKIGNNESDRICVSVKCDGVEKEENYSASEIAQMIIEKAFLQICRLFTNETEFRIMLTIPVKYPQSYTTEMLAIINRVNNYINEVREENNLQPVQFVADSAHTLQEPIAAVIACQHYLVNANNIMVIDLGGGTLDVAVVNITGKDRRKLNICRENGLEDCGGNEFDEEIAKLIKRKVENLGYRVEKGACYEKICIEARKVKEKFQNYNTDKVEFSLNRISTNSMWNEKISISYEEYYYQINELRSKVTKVIRDVIFNICDDKKIDKVLLVGGMAQERFLYDYLINEIHYDMNDIIIPDKYDGKMQGLISRGAAIVNREDSNLFVTNSIVSTIGVLLEDERYYTVFEPYTQIKNMERCIEFACDKYCQHMEIRLIEFFGEFSRGRYTILEKVTIRIPTNNVAIVCVEFSITKEHKINVVAYPKNHRTEEYDCEIVF